MKQKNPIRINLDKNSAVYSVKEQDGSFVEYSIDTPIFEMDSFAEYVELVEIQKGLILSIMRIPADVDLTVKFEYDYSPLAFGCALDCDVEVNFCLSGKLVREEVKGESLFISKTPDTKGFTRKKPGTPVISMDIIIDKNLAKILLNYKPEHVKKCYRDFFQDSCEFKNEIYKPSPIIRAIAESIIKCEYTSTRRDIYLRTKVIEFLNYAYAEHILDESGHCKKSVLQPNEIDKIKQIKNYIYSRLESPPSINELAKYFGLNEFKLKAGFKEIFGTTVYGYVQTEKMAKAICMLETGRYNVSEVAWDIGYTNVSHFISAFKKHYHVTPGQILTQAKNNLINSKIDCKCRGRLKSNSVSNTNK